MSLRKLTAGDGYNYLTRQVAAYDSTDKGHTSLADYYDEKGESPGRWMGAGLAALDLAAGETVTAPQMAALFGQGHHPRAGEIEAAMAARGCTAKQIAAATKLGREFPIHPGAPAFEVSVAGAYTTYNTERGRRWNTPIRPEERARIRTEVGTESFTEAHGRPPQDARELSGFVAKQSRQATTAVAGFDLTFSPVKSVSALWALAPRSVAAQIRAAHDAAVSDTVAWLEREVAHTREGRAGVRQVKVRGLVAAAFTHRDSRAGDPDLHTHVAVSNKVQTVDGRWLALDGRMLYAAKVAASEHYNTRLEAELIDRLGVEFTDRAPVRGADPGKRPVREIRGVSTTLTRFWSRRRADIEARQAVLAAEFQATHGRTPTAVEALHQAEQATLETRAAKHEHRSERDQRETWRAEADDVLGDPAEVDEMYTRAIGHGGTSARLTRGWVEDAATEVPSAVEASRATWNVWHLTAEAQRQARRAGIARSDLDTAVGRVVEAAISRSVRLGVDDPITEPPPLRRSDGQSVYDVHGATLYTSAAVLAAEQQILALAAQTGAHALADVRVEVAINSTANGVEINDAQAAMVRDLATSGNRVQLALAPAGTGKTTTMNALAQAWGESGGQVIGLAPSAQAAHELGQAIGGHTDTLAKLTWSLTHDPSAAWPRWIRDIGPTTLVIIDEAGQAATTDLAAALRFITGRGGAVRLVGDDQQLAAVGAGGVLRDIAETFGACTLSEVRRFDDPAEAAATLAVREGDAASLGFYADNARIHIGDLTTAADETYNAWAADRAAGLDTVLLAPTNEIVTQLNARARTDRTHGTIHHGPSVVLADGNHASAGDVIVTRRNNRRLPLSRSDWVKNGDRWRVEEVTPRGSLIVRHLDLRRTVGLPADYVAEHVQLGYATTVHGAQGMTADTAHLVATGEETRQTLYVGISRGRTTNHIYLATGYDGDPHSMIDPTVLRPPTAIDVLTDILERDGSDRSATTTQRDAAAPTTQLHEAALRYQDALGYAAEQTIGADALAALDLNIEAIWPGLTTEPAYPTLRAHLCLRALDHPEGSTDTDPITLLLDATNERELGTSHDRAAVLDWRLGHSHQAGPLPWLDAIPSRVAEDPTWSSYLAERVHRIAELAVSVRDDARQWPPEAGPAWAAGLTAPEQADLRADLALWRAAFGIPEAERRPTGARQPGTAAASQQESLDRRVRSVLGTHRADDTLLDLLPDDVRSDREFTRLSERLGALQAAGVDVGHLLTTVLDPDHPLPDEHAADALWWRLVRHLGPTALRASASHAHTLRPAWTTYLCERLGEATGERVMADAMWPALVAAVHARPTEWTAEQLLDAATSGRAPAVRAEDLCTALVWRIATMTDAPFNEPEPAEPEFDLDLGIDDPTPPPSDDPAPRKVDEPRTSAERILELNQAALEHYESLFDHSWAGRYLEQRLGTDLAGDSRFRVGYAPPGPTNLIQHLTARGATTEELLDAGLARHTERGRLIDTFRDRLIFPIHDNSGDHSTHDGTALVGFVGRRNPTKPDSEYAGPKYLNTRSTLVFTKGDQLYGLTENAPALTAGATPVLVEGPLDALAITLASNGQFVGIASLGTAFTQPQADKLAPHLAGSSKGVTIATDPDAAGRESARRAFWRLAALRTNPSHLSLPNGVDPADLLRTKGPAELRHRLGTATAFAEELIGHMINEQLPRHDHALARVDLARAAAHIIGALPPETWPEHAALLAERLELPLATIQAEIYEAGRDWTDDPQACVTRQLAAVRQAVPPTRRPVLPAQPTPITHDEVGINQAPAASTGIPR